MSCRDDERFIETLTSLSMRLMRLPLRRSRAVARDVFCGAMGVAPTIFD